MEEQRSLVAHDPECPSSEMPGRQRSLKLPWVALGLVSALALVVVAVPAVRKLTKSDAVDQAIELLTWETPHGKASATLQISGFESDCGRHLNGEFHYQGKTKDGRAYYKQAFNTGHAPFYLYYDRECDGAKGGKNNMAGSWRLNNDTFSKDKFEDKTESLAGNCGAYAFLFQPRRGKFIDANFVPGPPKAMPPRSHTWKVWCKGDWALQKVTIAGGAAEELKRIKGHWEYQTMVSEGDSKEFTIGQEHGASNGGSWEAGLEASAESTGKMGVPFVAEGEVTVSGTASASFQKSWDTMISASTESTSTYTFPRTGALFQWKFDAEADDGTKATFGANEFAITDHRGMLPKCVPGMVLDHPRYQKCVDGGWLPSFLRQP